MLVAKRTLLFTLVFVGSLAFLALEAAMLLLLGVALSGSPDKIVLYIGLALVLVSLVAGVKVLVALLRKTLA